MKQSHAFVFKQCGLEQLANIHQNLDKVTRSLKFGPDVSNTKSKAAGKTLFIIANFSHHIPILFKKIKKDEMQHLGIMKYTLFYKNQ